MTLVAQIAATNKIPLFVGDNSVEKWRLATRQRRLYELGKLQPTQPTNKLLNLEDGESPANMPIEYLMKINYISIWLAKQLGIEILQI